MGYSHIDFAATLDRSPSTISREINRNRMSSGMCKPAKADEKARARRWSGSRLDRDDRLREAARWRMAWGSSSPQAPGRLALEMGRPVISHESIYRFIVAQVKRTKDYDWRHSCRGRRRSVGGVRGRGAVPPCSSGSGAL